MQRMDITHIIGEMRIPFDSEVSVMDIYNAILSYCKATSTAPRSHKWTLSPTNVLIVDGSKLQRVGPIPRMFPDISGFDYEGAILAMGERWRDA